MKRFYKETAVDAGDGGFRVLLDGRPMRTPAKAVLVVPTEPLAGAIAERMARHSGEGRDQCVPSAADAARRDRPRSRDELSASA